MSSTTSHVRCLRAPHTFTVASSAATATTLPSEGFFCAVLGNRMPPVLSSSSAPSFTNTRSPAGFTEVYCWVPITIGSGQSAAHFRSLAIVSIHHPFVGLVCCFRVFRTFVVPCWAQPRPLGCARILSLRSFARRVARRSGTQRLGPSRVLLSWSSLVREKFACETCVQQSFWTSPWRRSCPHHPPPDLPPL